MLSLISVQATPPRSLFVFVTCKDKNVDQHSLFFCSHFLIFSDDTTVQSLFIGDVENGFKVHFSSLNFHELTIFISRRLSFDCSGGYIVSCGEKMLHLPTPVSSAPRRRRVGLLTASVLQTTFHKSNHLTFMSTRTGNPMGTRLETLE
jgi:hypothetical protein